jgi:hypothetical protein
MKFLLQWCVAKMFQGEATSLVHAKISSLSSSLSMTLLLGCPFGRQFLAPLCSL